MSPEQIADAILADRFPTTHPGTAFYQNARTMIVDGIERALAGQTADAVYGDLVSLSAYSDLDRGADIVNRISAMRQVQAELKAAFKGDELDGGWQTALTHPLYLRASAEIADLREQLKGLV